MQLSVNIDHVATLRNARGGNVPDPVEAARIAMRAGAVGIVCHLREDRRHIRDMDVKRLRTEIDTKLDLEMAATPEIIGIALKIKPELVTLVPERRLELTTEGGLDVVRVLPAMKKTVSRFHDAGIEVSLFIDPLKKQIDAAYESGAEMIELHTGTYADTLTTAGRKKQLDRLRQMAAYGRSLGLGVNAGHGLDYSNMKPVAKIKDIKEVSIGHAIIVRALFVGFERAVREMETLVR
jgi:pyridoxine 5-phosphate synthase